MADLTQLEQVSLDSICINMKEQFSKDHIYLSIGEVVIALNPYKPVDIYSDAVIEKYRGRNIYEMPPHIYCVGEAAYRNMRFKAQDQCIIISGEAGAGKTESSKILMKYIASVSTASDKVDRIKEQLLNCNPCLEAFGNAKTATNDNSSRFGKYMDMQFDFKGDPIGGKVTTYLLEKSRVFSQAKNERTFHIFYQLVKAFNDDLKRQLFINGSVDDFDILTEHGSNISIDGVDDGAEFDKVWKAMNLIGFSEDDRRFMLQGVAAVLHLGNISFKTSESANGGVEFANEKSQPALENTASLLGISSESLKTILTTRTVKDQAKSGADFKVPLPLDKANYSKDALSKALYGRLFDFLVERINSQIHQAATEGSSFIGILDVYGFELLPRNGFEQFCINYTNEKLQQLFIELTLNAEQTEYEKEGINWTHIEFFNNNIICELIESKNRGIFATLNEECMRPGNVTDQTFLAKLNATFIENAHYDSREKSKSDKTMEQDVFRINHYAGTVEYNIDGFIDKNTDMLNRDVLYGLNKSSKVQVKSMFPENPSQGDFKRPETIGMQFRTSIQSLMKNLSSKNPHYLRCIKTNLQQKSDVFDQDLVKHQCGYLGLIENIRIRKEGYCFRMHFDLFFSRFKMASPKTFPKCKGTLQEGLVAILEAAAIDASEYAFGKSKLFIRHPASVLALEKVRDNAKLPLARKIQACWRGYKVRKAYKVQRNAIIRIQSAYKMYKAKKDFRRRVKVMMLVTKVARGFLARRKYNAARRLQPKIAAQTIQRFWRGQIRYNFIMYNVKEAVAHSGINWRRVHWPQHTATTKKLSFYLKSVYIAQMARRLRNSLTPERKHLLELKSVASSFCSKKPNYTASIPLLPVGDYLKLGTANKGKWNSVNKPGDKVLCALYADKLHRMNPSSRTKCAFVISDNNLYILTGSLGAKEMYPLHEVQGLTCSPFADGYFMLHIKSSPKGDCLYLLPDSLVLFEFISQLHLATKAKGSACVIYCVEGFQTTMNKETLTARFVKRDSKSDMIKKNNSELIIHVKNSQ